MKRDTNTGRRPSKKKIILLAAALCALLAVSGCIALALQASKQDVLLYVDGQPVYQQELLYSVDNVKQYKRQQLAQAAGKEAGGIQWSDRINGKTGYEQLADEAVKDLTPTKVMQKEALDNRLTDVIDYPGLMKKQTEENRKRSRAKADGEAVYGVTQYSEQQYYQYFNQNLNIQNKAALIQNNTLTATDEEARAAYNANPGYFQNRPYEEVVDPAKNWVLDQKYQAHIEKLSAQAEISIPNRDRLIDAVQQHIG